MAGEEFRSKNPPLVGGSGGIGGIDGTRILGGLGQALGSFADLLRRAKPVAEQISASGPHITRPKPVESPIQAPPLSDDPEV